MKILYKYPTRQRPLLFSRTLRSWYENMEHDNFKFLISCDTDDLSMNSEEAKLFMSSFKNLSYRYDDNSNKIEACNKGVNEEEFDIVVLVSDDMVPEIKGYDKIIINSMKEEFPDTDGALWFFDGYNPDINTLSILGKKYYDRFNYIYHPSYVTQWCDQEHTDVAKSLGKLRRYEKVIVRHLHPEVAVLRSEVKEALSKHVPEYARANFFGHDDLWYRNSKGDADKATYFKRREAGFPK
jgi:hypothetical protein